MPTLTKALGQWQLPLVDGVRVRTRVPGVWGSIPSQVDPITYRWKIKRKLHISENWIQ